VDGLSRMRKAVVTGCNRGIGLAITKRLLKDDYEVYGTYRSITQELEGLQKLKNFKSFKLELDRSDSIDRLIEEVITPEKPDVLVNNAGMAQRKPFLSLTATDWQIMFETNFFSAVRLCQAVLPFMVEKRSGRVINIVSIGGQWGGIHQVHYAAAKASLINLTKSLAKLFSRENVTVNAIAPGSIDTEMIQGEIPTDPELKKNFFKTIPAGRLGKPSEIADLVGFLVSDQAGYITGQTIGINGGVYFE